MSQLYDVVVPLPNESNCTLTFNWNPSALEIAYIALMYGTSYSLLKHRGSTWYERIFVLIAPGCYTWFHIGSMVFSKYVIPKLV